MEKISPRDGLVKTPERAAKKGNAFFYSRDKQDAD